MAKKPDVSVDTDLANFAIDYAKKIGATYADARLESTTVNGFDLKNGVPQVAGFDRISGIGIRVLINNTLGFASTNKLSREHVRLMVEKAARITRSASRIGDPTAFSSSKAEIASYEVRQKVKLDDIDPKEKMKILMDVEKAIVATKIKMPGRLLSLSDFCTEKYFVNSEGSRILSKIPRTDLSYYITVAEGTRTAQRYWQYGSSGGFETIRTRDFDQLLVTEVKNTLINLKKAVSAPKGKIDVVVAPQVTGIMVHESIGHPQEADRLLGREAAQAGETFVTVEMIGTKMGSEAVSVVDDPTIPGSYGYYLYDDEGIKAGERWLMKNGVINEFLHNRETSAFLGCKTNGAARATYYDREAIVRMGNTYVKPGKQTEDELIEGVSNGVFLKNFMEWNIDDKRLNAKYTGAEAYLIKNGRIAEPVWRPTIEISTPKLWSSIDAVGNNLEHHSGTCGKAEPMQAIPVWFGGPSMRIRKIQLSD